MNTLQPQTQNSRHQRFTVLKMMKYKFYAEPVLVMLLAHCTLQVSGYTLCMTDYDKVDIATVSLRDENCNIIILFFWMQNDNEYSHLQYPTGNMHWERDL